MAKKAALALPFLFEMEAKGDTFRDNPLTYAVRRFLPYGEAIRRVLERGDRQPLASEADVEENDARFRIGDDDPLDGEP